MKQKLLNLYFSCCFCIFPFDDCMSTYEMFESYYILFLSKDF